jgi:TfoX N-terminal domain
MAYSEKLASRIREILAGDNDVAEKKMFGGVCFMANGHMAVGILGEELMVRTGESGFDEALKRPHARIMDFTGKPMRGFLVVAPAGIKTKDALAGWIGLGAAHARSLPPKKPKKSPAPRVKKTRAR